MNESVLMNWDELNLLRSSAVDLLREYRQTHDSKRARRWCDYFEFVMCLVYAYGWKDAEEIVGIVPMTDGLDDKAVNLRIPAKGYSERAEADRAVSVPAEQENLENEGETFRDRIFKQLQLESLDGILRIIDTEAHRDYNTGVYDCGKQSGISGLKKMWWTQMDNRVRESHQYLNGVVVGLEDYFYTAEGDMALFPGGFGVPDQDCNCRCFVTISK